MRVRIRAPLACRIAKVDRDRLNEAIARGDCPFAPTVSQGKARLFSINDVVALYIYGRLVERGFASRSAGQLAKQIGELAEVLQGHEDAVGVSVLHTLSGGRQAMATLNVITKDGLSETRVKELLKRKDEIESATGQAVGSPSVLYMTGGDRVYNQETWQIGAILHLIHHEIEEYRNTIGEEETLG
jgi:hypothetical protein